MHVMGPSHKHEYSAWLVTALASHCALDPSHIDVRERFIKFGLDSLGATRLIAKLSAYIGRPISPTVIWEYPTIAALASHLAGETPSAPALERPEREMGHAPEEPIAIVGMACRFPGAPDIKAFWKLLQDGVEAVSSVPAARGWDSLLSARGIEPAERAKVSRGAFLSHVDTFEPLFFGISPREAIAMDPQQRLMLELCWEALEDAGIPPGQLKGHPVGVFTGAIWSDYEVLLYRGAPGLLGPYTCSGSHRSIIANRLSYFLGLTGPSLTLDSACSSGLVVVHLACDSLRRGESRLALAGAVNLNLLPESALAVSRFGVLSPDARCYTFDARANGYVRGEGGGMVVLKTLSRAIADGDPIYAVIRGSAVNNDGASNGLTAPSRAAQEAVLGDAYRRAGVPPGEVQYVEAHGTGTPLGDPIEAHALGAVLGAGRAAAEPLWVGSAKTNIGHLESAAGMVGLIKVALAIQHRMIPPSLHFVTPNPHAPLADLGLAVPTAACPWPAPAKPLLAGVSAFGFGGTNSHVVLQQWLAPVPDLTLGPRADGACTQRGIVFVFPGQGAQWYGMARSLLHSEPVFRAALVACDRYVRRYAGWSLLGELAAPKEFSRLGRIEVSLPAIIAIDIAVAAWWRALGIEPAAVVGHSTGEIAAAHVAGALDLDDTMRVICAYGRCVSRFAGRSGMAFVGLPWEKVAPALAGVSGRVFPAIQDSIEGTVLSGEPDALKEVMATLQVRGVLCRPVSINVGPHSPLVDSARADLAAELAGIRPRRGTVPLISEVTGAEVDGGSLDAEHWVRNFGDPALFSDAVCELIRRGHRVFLDVGPHPITKHSIEINLRRTGCAPAGADGGVVFSSLRRDEDGRVTLRETLSALIGRGFAANPQMLAAADPEEPHSGAGLWLLPLSARSQAALVAQANAYAGLLRAEQREPRLQDIVYTASLRREHHSHRLAVVGRGRTELAAALLSFVQGDASASIIHGQSAPAGPPKLVFVFSGQGSQWLGMGRKLLAEEAVFRTQLEDCDTLLRQHVPWSLLEELAAPAERSRLDETEVAQPALFAVQVSLAALLRSWGVIPDAVIGHSVGELAAAYVCGALSLGEALRLLSWRSRLMQRATGQGKMAWVALPRLQAVQAIAGREALLSIAAVNDPESVVLSGEAAALAAVLAELAACGVEHRWLRVNYAFHSPQMDGLAAELVQSIGAVARERPSIPFYSTVTGGIVSGDALDAAYWGRNVRDPVELSQAVAAAFADGHRLYVEVGPHPSLAVSLSQCVAAESEVGQVVPTLSRGGDERRAMLQALGKLWAHERAVDFESLLPLGGRVVPLPAYPWQRERFWVDTSTGRSPQRLDPGAHPLLGVPFGSVLHPEERGWELGTATDAGAWLSEQRVQGEAIFPHGAFFEMALAAGASLYGTGAFALVNLRFERVLKLPCGTLQVAVARQEAQAALTLASRAAETEPWLCHVTADLAVAPNAPETREPLDLIRKRCSVRMPVSDFAAHLGQRGVEPGPGHRAIEELWMGEHETLACLRLPAELLAEAALYQTHPVLLDGCLQAAMAHLLGRSAGRVLWPAAISRARLWARLPEQVFVHVKGDAQGLDLRVRDADGRMLLEMTAVRCVQMEGEGANDPLSDCAHVIAWRRQTLPDEPPASRLPFAVEPVEQAPWLILLDAGGTGAALARVLRARGELCIEVDAAQLSALPALLPRSCRGVVHCRSLDATPFSETTPATLESDLRRGSYEALLLAQAILRRGFRDPPRLFLLTRGAQAVTTQAVAPAQAPLWGAARCLSLEHPELACTRIDLPPVPQPDEPERVARELLAGDDEDQIALREDGRFVARLVRGDLLAASAESYPIAPPALISEKGTYLITGGLGGLGLLLADWLVKQGARHLALVGRRPATAAATAAIAAMQEAGATVQVLLGDVAQLADVERILGAIANELPPLRGIVHAAAVLADRTLLELGEEQFFTPIRPKVLGAWNLHAATRKLKLDFFVMYSSLASLLGSPGQVAYAAGNAFLDALAHARVAQGLPAMSIQWGPFAEVGLAAAQSSLGVRLSARGLDSLLPAEGLALLGRLLLHPRPEVGLFRLSLRRWMEALPQAAGMRYLAELPLEPAAAESGTALGLRAELSSHPPADRAAFLEQHVIAQLGRVLCLDPSRIDRHAPFSSLGLDSLLGLETRNRLEKSLGIKLPPTLFFTYPQPVKLAEYLLSRLELPDGARDSSPAAPNPDPPPLVPAAIMEEDALLAAFDESMRRLDQEGLS